jgi:ABC-type lipoprotein export system ATPase subunit
LRPALILADEPTSGLDTQMTRRMLGLFRGIAHQQGTAFIAVSHDAVIAEYADRAYDLIDGKLALRAGETQPSEPEPVSEPSP